jgi:hypothetical protein
MFSYRVGIHLEYVDTANFFFTKSLSQFTFLPAVYECFKFSILMPTLDMPIFFISVTILRKYWYLIAVLSSCISSFILNTFVNAYFRFL